MFAHLIHYISAHNGLECVTMLYGPDVEDTLRTFRGMFGDVTVIRVRVLH